MGIDVCELGRVRLNDEHNERLITCVNKNPTVCNKKGLTISSIYRRTKHGDQRRDGNPFIYAMKGKKGFTITNRELYRFKPSFIDILDKIQIPNDVDCFVGMPSGHVIVNYFGVRLARKFGVKYSDDWFIKRTVGDVLDNFDLTNVKDKDQRAVKRVLSGYKKLPKDAQVSLKNIENKIRGYFPPLSLAPGVNCQNANRIVLVDDLLSTGTTLLSARDCLTTHGVMTEGAFCLLSELSK